MNSGEINWEKILDVIIFLDSTFLENSTSLITLRNCFFTSAYNKYIVEHFSNILVLCLGYRIIAMVLSRDILRLFLLILLEDWLATFVMHFSILTLSYNFLVFICHTDRNQFKI